MSPTREELPELVRWAKRIGWTLGKLGGQVYDEAALSGAALRGLRDALATHDPTRGVAFKRFARERICGEVRDMIRSERRRASREVPLNDALDDGRHGELGGDNEADEAVEAFVASCIATEIGAGGEAGLLRRERYAALHQAIGPLAPEAQRLLDLHYWEGLPWKDVGAACGLSEQAAKDLDRKLRRHLRAVLGAREDDGPGRAGARVVPLSRPPRRRG